MVVAIPEQIYDGSELKPDVTLKYGDYTLEQDTDYTVSYEQNSSTGITEITATGKGFFNGTITVPFKVGIAINETTFPDTIFRAYVKENFDTTADDILTSSELAQIKDIDVTGKGISDLTGIQYFTQLTQLNCSDNELTTLDISQNTRLSRLTCSNNKLTALNLHQNTKLEYLDFQNNNLTAIDLSQNAWLRYLYCNDNHLTVLDISKNLSLEYLDCSSNNLKKLDVQQNTALRVLNCSYNHLTQLDVQQNTKLIVLLCDKNQLTSLDVSQNENLTSLSCNRNEYCIDTINGTFDLSKLPDGFDSAKASNWEHATVDGNTLILSDPRYYASYDYVL